MQDVTGGPQQVYGTPNLGVPDQAPDPQAQQRQFRNGNRFFNAQGMARQPYREMFAPGADQSMSRGMNRQFNQMQRASGNTANPDRQFANGNQFVNANGMLRKPYRDMPGQMQTPPAPQRAGGSPPMGAPTTPAPSTDMGRGGGGDWRTPDPRDNDSWKVPEPEGIAYAGGSGPNDLANPVNMQRFLQANPHRAEQYRQMQERNAKTTVPGYTGDLSFAEQQARQAWASQFQAQHTGGGNPYGDMQGRFIAPGQGGMTPNAGMFPGMGNTMQQFGGGAGGNPYGDMMGRFGGPPMRQTQGGSGNPYGDMMGRFGSPGMGGMGPGMGGMGQNIQQMFRGGWGGGPGMGNMRQQFGGPMPSYGGWGGAPPQAMLNQLRPNIAPEYYHAY